jgi:hypothetical protein
MTFEIQSWTRMTAGHRAGCRKQNEKRLKKQILAEVSELGENKGIFSFEPIHLYAPSPPHAPQTHSVAHTHAQS